MDVAITVIELIVVLVIVVGLLSQAVRIVREYQRLVVFRLGKCIGSRGPGPVWLIPLVDRPVQVDLRELYFEVPHQSCITQDNVPIKVDFLIYSQVMDAISSVVAVQNFSGASQGIAATTLRAVIGDIPLDDVLAERERINNVMRQSDCRRDSGDRTAARCAGCDESTDVGGAHAARQCHRSGRQTSGEHHGGGG